VSRDLYPDGAEWDARCAELQALDPLEGTRPAEVVISFDGEWWNAHLVADHGGRFCLAGSGGHPDEVRTSVAIINHALPGAPIRVEHNND
jgi:hypothetical protein